MRRIFVHDRDRRTLLHRWGPSFLRVPRAITFKKSKCGTSEDPLYVAFHFLCLAIFVWALVGLVFRIGAMPEYIHFVFPGLAANNALFVTTRFPQSRTIGSFTAYWRP
jgi:hypothetical protein